MGGTLVRFPSDAYQFFKAFNATHDLLYVHDEADHHVSSHRPNTLYHASRHSIH